jgi:hypothetical protein
MEEHLPFRDFSFCPHRRKPGHLRIITEHYGLDLDQFPDQTDDQEQQ